MYRKKISISKLEKDLCFSRGAIYKIENSCPSIEKLEKIADYFQVSTDFLLNREKGAISMSKVPKRIFTLIDKCKNHNEIANKCNIEIRQWLYDNNALNDTMVDQLIDVTDQGQGSAEYLFQFFIDHLEYAQKEGNTYDV